MQKSFCLLICLIFTFCLPVRQAGLLTFAFASDTDLVINANSILYDKEHNVIEALGSVEATYKDLKINTQHLLYNTAEDRIITDRDFYLSLEKYKLNGQKLDYFYKKGEGVAGNVKIDFFGIQILGREVKIDTEKVDLSSASFTSCSLEKPHYHLSASQIILYPDSGWIIAYLGIFWLDGLPTLPIPAYIYDVGPITAARKHTAPLPEIGSNQIDGTYINERIAWRFSSRTYGQLTLSYATLKGLGAGFETNYIINDYNQGNVRIFGSQGDGLWGGISETYAFGREMETKKEEVELFKTFKIPLKRQFELETNLSFRERINYERVSFLPNVTLRLNEVKLIDSLKGQAAFEVGAGSEESTGISTWRGDLKAGLSHDLDLRLLGVLTSNLDYDYLTYSIGQRWVKWEGKTKLNKTWPVLSGLETGIGYSHYFLIDGASPFNFEKYRFSPFDVLNLSAFLNVGVTRFGVDTYFNVPVMEAKDIDYSIGTEFHCFELTVSWRAVRREFVFGVNLISR